MGSLMVDLNCDLGESYGTYTFGQDKLMLDIVSSVNIACGYHAGDDSVLDETVRLAVQKKVAIGAHPGFPDRQGFGRRNLDVSAREVYTMMVYQIGAIAAFTRVYRTRLHHVKPHGALYHLANSRQDLAEAVVQSLFDYDETLLLYAPPVGELVKAARAQKIRTVNECFADRTYQHDGQLTPRNQPQAVLEDVSQAVRQVLNMVYKQQVETVDGSVLPIRAETICVHGDHKRASDLAARIKKSLLQAGVKIQAPGIMCDASN